MIYITSIVLGSWFREGAITNSSEDDTHRVGQPSKHSIRLYRRQEALLKKKGLKPGEVRAFYLIC